MIWNDKSLPDVSPNALDWLVPADRFWATACVQIERNLDYQHIKYHLDSFTNSKISCI